MIINPPQKTQSTTEKLTHITERKMEVNTTPIQTATDVRGPRTSSLSPGHSLSLLSLSFSSLSSVSFLLTSPFSYAFPVFLSL